MSESKTRTRKKAEPTTVPATVPATVQEQETRPVGRPPKEVTIRDLRMKLMEAQAMAQLIRKQRLTPGYVAMSRVERDIQQLIKIVAKRDTEL